MTIVATFSGALAQPKTLGPNTPYFIQHQISTYQKCAAWFLLARADICKTRNCKYQNFELK